MHLISPGGKALIRRRSGRGVCGYKRLVGACVNYLLAPGGEEGALDVDSKAGSPPKEEEARMKMRASSIAVLFNIFSASWAEKGNPCDIKLKWLEDADYGGETLSRMEVTFANGARDEIFLKAHQDSDYTTDECSFHGTLKGDIQSEVEVDGCKNKEATVEIVSRLIPCNFAIAYLDENGETHSIDVTDGITFRNAIDSAPPPTAEALWTGARWEGALPRTVTAKFHVRIERSLVDQEGGEEKAKKKVHHIINLARPWFKKWLGLPMDIDLEVQSMETYYGEGTPIGDPHLEDPQGDNIPVPLLAGKGGRDHPTAWFKAPYRQNITHVALAGIADLPGLCNETSGPLSTFLFSFQSLH